MTTLLQLAKRLTEWSSTIKPTQRCFTICSGGEPGFMEAANRGAHLAGRESVGLNISLPVEQEPDPYQTDNLTFEFHYFFIRKYWFAYLAKAIVVFPGGFGTLDELFELLTLVQTQKTTKYMPTVLYGSDYWNEVVNFDAMVRWGTINKEDLEELKISTKPEVSTKTEESDDSDISIENLKEEEEAQENTDIKEDTEATNS